MLVGSRAESMDFPGTKEIWIRVICVVLEKLVREWWGGVGGIYAGMDNECIHELVSWWSSPNGMMLQETLYGKNVVRYKGRKIILGLVSKSKKNVMLLFPHEDAAYIPIM